MSRCRRGTVLTSRGMRRWSQWWAGEFCASWAPSMTSSGRRSWARCTRRSARSMSSQWSSTRFGTGWMPGMRTSCRWSWRSTPPEGRLIVGPVASPASFPPSWGAWPTRGCSLPQLIQLTRFAFDRRHWGDVYADTAIAVGRGLMSIRIDRAHRIHPWWRRRPGGVGHGDAHAVRPIVGRVGHVGTGYMGTRVCGEAGPAGLAPVLALLAPLLRLGETGTRVSR